MSVDDLDRRLEELAAAAAAQAAPPEPTAIRRRAQRRRLGGGVAVLATVAAVVAAVAVLDRPLPPPSGPPATAGPARPGTASSSPAAPSEVVPWAQVSAKPRLPTPTAPDGASPAEALTVSVKAPATAVLGRPLHYTVTIANTGTTGVPLRPCPNYDERLNVGGVGQVTQSWQLNCATVGSIEPGQRVTFAMVFLVPAGLRPGTAVLLWNLDLGPGAQHKPIEVVRP